MEAKVLRRELQLQFRDAISNNDYEAIKSMVAEHGVDGDLEWIFYEKVDIDTKYRLVQDGTIPMSRSFFRQALLENHKNMIQLLVDMNLEFTRQNNYMMNDILHTGNPEIIINLFKFSFDFAHFKIANMFLSVHDENITREILKRNTEYVNKFPDVGWTGPGETNDFLSKMMEEGNVNVLCVVLEENLLDKRSLNYYVKPFKKLLRYALFINNERLAKAVLSYENTYSEYDFEEARRVNEGLYTQLVFENLLKHE